MTYTFTWNHKSGKKEASVVLPLKIDSSTSHNGKNAGKLICNKCNGAVKQVYRCEHYVLDKDGKKTFDKKGNPITKGCGAEYTIRDIKNRLDADENVIYSLEDKNNFLSAEIKNRIAVVKEVVSSDVLLNIELLCSFKEIHTDDDDTAILTLKKVHEWLHKHDKALLVNFGYRGRDRGGFIIASKDRLVLAELRDYRLVKETKQPGIAVIKSKDIESIQKVSEDKSNDDYYKFIGLVKKGKKIPAKKKASADKTKVKVASFLDD